MYQNIMQNNSEFEYIPISVFKGKSNKKLKFIKQYNYSIENDEYIKINFKEKIKPNKIVLNDISSNFNIKVDLFGFKNNVKEYIKSAEKINNEIVITLDNNIHNYSSYLFSFKIEKSKSSKKLDLIFKWKNKLKKLLLKQNLSSANIESIDFIF